MTFSLKHSNDTYSSKKKKNRILVTILANSLEGFGYFIYIYIYILVNALLDCQRVMIICFCNFWVQRIMPLKVVDVYFSWKGLFVEAVLFGKRLPICLIWTMWRERSNSTCNSIDLFILELKPLFFRSLYECSNGFSSVHIFFCRLCILLICTDFLFF